MDTPEKARIGSPMSNFEESPFSNFINSLSPIKPSKTIRVSHSFGSLNFSSPPSVFTSPQINLQRESRFLKRDQLLELEKSESSSIDEDNDKENKDVIREDAGKADNWPSNSKDDSCEDLNLSLKYDCGSSSFQTGSSFGCEMKNESSTNDSFGTQVSSVETEKNVDGSRCDWDNLMFDAPDLLVFESPQGQGAMKNLPDKSGNEDIDLFSSLMSQFPEDDVNDMEQQHGLGPLNSNDQITELDQEHQLKQIYQGQDNDGNSSSNGSFTGQTSIILENKHNLQRGVRRRCLVFEIPGAKKNINDGSISNTSSQDEANKLPNDNSMRMRPGIGLHLNALALASMGQRVLSLENSSFENQQSRSAENEAQLIEDASAYGILEELNPNSPKKKRRRPDNSGDGEASCKRCNCKKSKCLKLYCECFAAGVYCVEPCACQDCFNKPIHEETVLATRKQIESRNPLAFAPKVIRNSDSVNEFVDDSNRTPASARHKRGCNCKKSNCLKKYCECFQGGVGCSIGCRCEGCKNTFGRKDGSSGSEMELDVEEDAPVHENTSDDNSLVQHEINIDEELNPVPVLPTTPLRLFRSPMPLSSVTNGKPSRFGGILSSSSLLSRDGIGRTTTTFLRAQHKTDKHHLQNVEEFPAVLQNTSPNSNVKTLSPNSKRITPPNYDNLGQSPGLRSSRKLILQSIPSFPSLTPRR